MGIDRFKHRLILSVLAFAALGGTALADDAQYPSCDFQWVAEEYPPFQTQEPDGKWKGIAIQSLEKAFETMHAPVPNVVKMPWARGLRELNSERPTVLFSMVDSPERAERYRLVGPFYRYEIGLFGRPSLVTDRKPSRKLVAGVVRGDIAEQYIRQSGFDGELQRLATQEDVLKLYQSGRIDLMLYTPTMRSFMQRYYPELLDELTSYQALPMVDLYFAFNKAVDADCVDIFDSALAVASAQASNQP